MPVAVNNYQRLMQPVLMALAENGGEADLDEIHRRVTARLTGDPVGHTALRWALMYLQRQGLVCAALDDAYGLTPWGDERIRQCRAECAATGDTDKAGRPAQRQRHRRAPATGRPRQGGDALGDDERHRKLIAAHRRMLDDLKTALIDTVYNLSPTRFEEIIIDLLVAMGYGRGHEHLHERLGRSGDGGIDGIVSRDELALDVIYIQAKRYRPAQAVPVSAVRDFAGALEARNAGKGVMVSTSRFSSAGRRYIRKLARRVILIDGQTLASLMIKHNVGVRLERRLDIKTIDRDFFAPADDNRLAGTNAAMT